MIPSSSSKPTKRVIALGIVAVAIIGSIAIVRFWRGDLSFIISKFSKNSPEVALLPLSINEDIQEYPDTDGDGLRDWEELLWGSDKNKKDTDGDGTIDGDEVISQRNPVKSGPDDSLEIAEAVDASGEQKKPLTTSDQISRELLAKLVSLKNQGEIPLEQKEVLVAELLRDTTASFQYKIYNKNGLGFTAGDSLEEVRQYASNFAVLQTNFLLQLGQNQKLLAKDLSILGKLYEDLAKNLYEISVPQAIANEHLMVVNNYSVEAQVYKALANSSNDPVIALTALRYHQKIQASHGDILKTISSYIKSRGIIFTQEEAGSFWNNF